LIIKKYRKYGISFLLYKEKKYPHIKRRKWTKDEEEFLIGNFSNTTNRELGEKLNRTPASVIKKSVSFNLKKSKEHKGKTIGMRNKMVGRDLTFDTLKNIAKKYKTRGEFQRLDPSAYTVSRINGHLNNICSHMIKNQYSIPQMILGEMVKIIIDENIIYNDRMIIKPYELDIYSSKYKLAFEYDGKRWHNNNNKDIIKNNLCIEKDILLIRIVENSRNYTKDIKYQLIEKIDSINKWCEIDITKDNILSIDENFLYKCVNDNIQDEDYIMNIISKYIDFTEFRKNEPRIYGRLLRMKSLKEYTKDLKRNIVEWDNEKIDNEISKYEYLNDFIKQSNPCYLYVIRHNLKYKLDKLKRKNIVWTIDGIKKVIKKNNIRTIYKLKKLYPGSMKLLKRTDKIGYIRDYMNKLFSI